ncbi:MAG: hypothetical protein ACP5IE_03980 [Infirmifilum sp.]
MGLRDAFTSWFRIKGRSLEHVSFAIRRLTGIIMAFYLLGHLVDITTLLAGPEAYSQLLNLFAGPIGVVIDSFLWAVLVIHGTLGIYSAIVETGFLLEHRRKLLVIAWICALLFILLGVEVIINVLR